MCTLYSRLQQVIILNAFHGLILQHYKNGQCDFQDGQAATSVQGHTERWVESRSLPYALIERWEW